MRRGHAVDDHKDNEEQDPCIFFVQQDPAQPDEAKHQTDAGDDNDADDNRDVPVRHGAERKSARNATDG